MVITNQLRINNAANTNFALPKAYDLAWDPYTGETFLTNNLGIHINLSGIVYVYAYDTATTFKGDANGGSENDISGLELYVYGIAPDGKYYEADAYGTGKITAKLDSKGKTTMSFSLSNGGGYAEYKSSYDGCVSGGAFKFSGSGVAPTNGIPFSVWSWNN